MPINRILFVRTDRIGDVLMNLPAIHLLRQAHPKAWITLLSGEELRGLFAELPDVDEFMGIDSKKIKNNFTAKLNLIQKIKKIRYDAIIISNPDKFFHFLSFVCGIPNRVGYGRKWGFLLNFKLKKFKNSSSHEIDRNLALARLLANQEWDGRFNWYATREARAKIAEKLRSENPQNLPAILIHTGTTNPSKRWEPRRFGELCEKIFEAGNYQIIFVGGDEEKQTVQGIIEKISAPDRILNWAGRLTLDEFHALVLHDAAQALVSSDSGPVHIAWMSELPVIVLYAKNLVGATPERWGPKSSAAEVIYKNMNEISPGEVWLALRKILSKKQVIL